MQAKTNDDPETSLILPAPSADGALATPPVSASAASGAGATPKARKKATRAQGRSQEPTATKAKKGTKKPAKGASASATQDAATEPEVAPAPTAKTSTKPSKAKRTSTPEPAKAPKPSKKPAPSSMPRSKPAPAEPWLAKVSDATLSDAAQGFLAELDAEGASEATVSGYKRELKVAMAHFGKDKLFALIQPYEVAAFYESDAVMIARDGALQSRAELPAHAASLAPRALLGSRAGDAGERSAPRRWLIFLADGPPGRLAGSGAGRAPQAPSPTSKEGISMEIADALVLYAQQLRADGRSQHTIDQVRRHVLVLAHWAACEGPGCDLEALDHVALARFLGSEAARLRPDGAPKRPGSLNALRSSLKTFLGYCHAAGYLRQDPGRLVRRARCGPGPPRALSGPEQDRLLAVLADAPGPQARRDELLARVLLEAGLRLGEALALDDDDVDFEAGQLWLRATKNGRPGRAFLPVALAERLRAHVDAQGPGPLFQARHGQRISPRHARRRLVAALERAGVRQPASPHSLRHSFATGLLARTGDLRLVQQALRHRSIASTTVYAGVEEGRLRAAVRAGQ